MNNFRRFLNLFDFEQISTIITLVNILIRFKIVWMSFSACFKANASSSVDRTLCTFKLNSCRINYWIAEMSKSWSSVYDELQYLPIFKNLFVS